MSYNIWYGYFLFNKPFWKGIQASRITDVSCVHCILKYGRVENWKKKVSALSVNRWRIIKPREKGEKNQSLKISIFKRQQQPKPQFLTNSEKTVLETWKNMSKKKEMLEWLWKKWHILEISFSKSQMAFRIKTITSLESIIAQCINIFYNTMLLLKLRIFLKILTMYQLYCRFATLII